MQRTSSLLLQVVDEKVNAASGGSAPRLEPHFQLGVDRQVCNINLKSPVNYPAWYLIPILSVFRGSPRARFESHRMFCLIMVFRYKPTREMETVS